MIIDAVSDLHGHYPKLEGGDLLIVAGDLTRDPSLAAYIEFIDWLIPSSKLYKKTVVIAGNHDTAIEDEPTEFMNISKSSGWFTYLQDSGTEFEGLKIWGSPWTRKFPGMNPKCMAFTCDTEEQLAEKWALIPGDTDILVTHSPAHGILDKSFNNQRCGSQSLYETLKNAHFKPQLHVFGHIHEAYGNLSLLGYDSTIYVNASHVNEFYYPENPPVKIVL